MNEKSTDGTPGRKGLRVVKLLPAISSIEVVDERGSDPTQRWTLLVESVEVAVELPHLDTYAKAEQTDKSAPLRAPCVIVGSTTQQMPKLEEMLIKHKMEVEGSSIDEPLRLLTRDDPSVFDPRARRGVSDAPVATLHGHSLSAVMACS